jgi:hypothetical protein
MPKWNARKKKAPKRVLALPDFEHAKTAVLNSLTSGRRPRGGGARQHRKAGAARSATNLRPPLPPGGRRTRPDPVPARPRVHPDDRALPGMQAETPGLP